MFRSDWEALPDVRKWSVVPPVCPVVIGRSSRMSGSGERPSRMSGSCREVLPDVCEWSGGGHECPVVVGRFSRMSGSGREALPYV